jgi:hypothetical protein
MKRQAYTIIGAMVLVAVFSMSTAKAQSSQLMADIPFDFSASDQTLPAGKYFVNVANPASGNNVLRIRSADGKTSVALLTHSVISKRQDNARLVFHRIGERYFLAQAWSTGDSTGMEAPKSRSERATERELSSSLRNSEAVALKRY